LMRACQRLQIKIFHFFCLVRPQKKSRMPWRRGKDIVHKTKNELAIEMLKWAIDNGFPKCTVLADSWFGVEPFIKELKRLKLHYVVEIKANLNVNLSCQKPKLTPKGRLCKHQFDSINIVEFFKTVFASRICGLEADREEGKKQKILYHTKIANIRLNAISDKHRVVESFDPTTKTAKYLLTDQLTWEATKIISIYDYRWAIEEFFRNAKQLTDMEGATIRSEQGVTISLCLVSWIDSLLHLENWKQSIAGKLTKEPLTVPSIVRRAQYENLEALLEKLETDNHFVERWLWVEKKRMNRKRKKRYELVNLGDGELKTAA